MLFLTEVKHHDSNLEGQGFCTKDLEMHLPTSCSPSFSFNRGGESRLLPLLQVPSIPQMNNRSIICLLQMISNLSCCWPLRVSFAHLSHMLHLNCTKSNKDRRTSFLLLLTQIEGQHLVLPPALACPKPINVHHHPTEISLCFMLLLAHCIHPSLPRVLFNSGVLGHKAMRPIYHSGSILKQLLDDYQHSCSGWFGQQHLSMTPQCLQLFMTCLWV